MNISNAIKAIEAIKNKPEYANLRIAHGKDRCANPPRSGPQGASSGRRHNHNGGANGNQEPVSAIDQDGEMLDIGDYEEEGEGQIVAGGAVGPAGGDGQQMHVDDGVSGVNGAA